MRTQKQIQNGRNYQLVWFQELDMYQLWKRNDPEWKAWAITFVFAEGTGVHIRFNSVADTHKVAKLAGIAHYEIWEAEGTSWRKEKRVFVTEDLEKIQKLVAERKEEGK